MKPRTLLLPAALVLASLAALPAAAGEPAEPPQETMVGQAAPEVSAGYWLNSPALSLGGLRGKIVVVEFWATWCPPCRKSIPHLMELYQALAAKGVVFVALTKEPQDVVVPFAREMKMNYPVGGESPTGGLYNVRGIPHAFIVDPSGVIAWEGHPLGGLDKALEAQLAKTPPVMMSARDKATYLAVLDLVDRAVKDGKVAEAAIMLTKVQRPEADADVLARVLAVRQALGSLAEKRIAEAEKDIGGQRYAEADLALEAVSALAPGTEAAKKAEDRRKELRKNETVRWVIEQGRKEHDAETALAEAEKAARGQPAQATLKALDEVAARYPGTKAGKAAADKAKALRADPFLAGRLQADQVEKECRGLLSMARNFLKAGLPEKARPYLDEVLRKHPDTEYAKEAKALLTEAGK